MMLALTLGLMVMLAAASMGLMEKALGPDSGRFPCVGRELIWVMRLYTAALFWRSCSILLAVYRGDPPEVALEQFATACLMAVSHTFLLVQVLRMRLPEGTWRRVQARIQRTRNAARIGGGCRRRDGQGGR